MRQGITEGILAACAAAIFVILVSGSASAAGTTNVSILYGWDGAQFSPVQIDGNGALKTTLNLTESIGIFPRDDSLYDVGKTTLRWRAGYFFNITSYGHINVTGTSGNSTFSGDVRILGTLYGGSPLKIGSGINISTGSGEDALFVSDGSGNKIFRITESGKLNITTSAGNFSVDDSTLFVDVTNNLVGIGTNSPQNRLEVVGATTLAGGVNASSLNVTGFSITDDSLVTLADGSKKKIKDVKAGEYVLTLEEKTGKLVPRKVNALLDHGIKPIYEMATEDGRAINTTGEHPYFVKPDSLPNKMSKASEGVITLSDKDSFNPLSPDSILQSNLRDKATYGTSFKCGAINTASFALSSNALKGIISTDLLMNSSTSKISTLDNFDREDILSRLSSISEYIYCVEINSNLLNIMKIRDFQDTENLRFSRVSFNSKTKRDLPIVINDENTTLKSTTKSIFYGTLLPLGYSIPAESKNLLDTDKLTSSASSFACFSVNLDLDTIDSILFISDNFSLNSSFKNLENNNCHIFSGIFLPSTVSNSLLTSSGTLNSNSSILASTKNNNNNAVFKDIAQWIEVRYLKAGDEIAVPDYPTGAIKWVKISSIKSLDPQHVYDLSIEGTRNFIANDIVAHNTYLAVNSGRVGIGNTQPNVTLHVSGRANITGYLEVGQGLNVSNGMNVISGNVGIGTTNPDAGLKVNTSDTTKGFAVNVGTGSATAAIAEFRSNDIARMVINSSGNVGIGTTGPGLKFEAKGTSGAAATSGTTQTGIGRFSQGTGTQVLDFGMVNGGYSWIQSTQSDDLSVEWPLVLNQNGGNVGIGTTSPGGLLTVAGRLNLTGVDSESIRIDHSGGNYYTIGRSTQTGHLVFYGNQNNANGYIFNGTNGERMRIDTNGNVGIGTTSPGRKLTVHGDTNLSGLNYIGNGSTTSYRVFKEAGLSGGYRAEGKSNQVSTSAVAIFNVSDQSQGVQLLVSGQDSASGANQFFDVVMQTGSTSVVSTQLAATGSPASRTYGAGNWGQITLAMGSGTYNLYVQGWGFW